MWKLLLLLLIILLISPSFSSVLKKGKVYDLTDDNFDDFIKNNKFVFVKFHATWCGRSKAIDTPFVAAAKEIQEENKWMKFAQVDENQKEILQRYSISSFPVLILFEDGIRKDYRGKNYQEKEMIQWLNKSSITKLEMITNTDEFYQFSTNFASDNSKALLFHSSISSPYYKKMISISKEWEGIEVKFVPSAFSSAALPSSLLSEVKEKGEGVFIFRNFGKPKYISLPLLEDEEENDNNNGISILISSLYSLAYPPLVEFSTFHYNRFQEMGKEWILMGAVNYTDPSSYSNFKQFLTQVEKNLPLSFALTIVDAGEFRNGLIYAGATGKLWPTIMAVNYQTKKQIVWDEYSELNEDNLLQWVEDLQTGTYKIFKKSEATPEYQPYNVIVLVADNFEKEVSKYRFSFILYYSPRDKMSMNFISTWVKLADYYHNQLINNNDNINDNLLMFGIIDATENYIEKRISHFPTLIFSDFEKNKEKNAEINYFPGDIYYANSLSFDDIKLFIDSNIPSYKVKENNNKDKENVENKNINDIEKNII